MDTHDEEAAEGEEEGDEDEEEDEDHHPKKGGDGKKFHPQREMDTHDENKDGKVTFKELAKKPDKDYKDVLPVIKKDMAKMGKTALEKKDLAKLHDMVTKDMKKPAM